MLPIREQLSHRGSTNAGLRCTSRIHRNQSPTSIFGFVGKFCDKRRPTSIVHILRQHATSETFDVQVFDNPCAEVSNQPERLPMLKLISQSKDSSVNVPEQRDSPTSAMRPLLATGHTALRSTKFGFRALIPMRIGNRIAVGRGSEGFKPNIHPDGGIENGEWFCFAKANAPLAAFAPHRDRLNFARYGTMQLDFDFADALNSQPIPRKFDSIAATRKSDAIETATRLKSRVARFRAPLYSTEERIKGLCSLDREHLDSKKFARPRSPAARISFN